MKVLVLNCGSSSIKYQFIDTETEIALAKGKKQHDKRETIKRREQQRDIDRAMRRK